MFADLPEALVEEMLSHYKKLGDQMTKSLDDVQNARESIRSLLSKEQLLKNEATVIRAISNPTTCAIDGGRAIERLMSTDIVAIAGLGVEGLSPPTETRHWERPRHRCFIVTANHYESTFVVAEAIMFTIELELATKAPHDVVLLDGSLETALIKFNLAISKLSEVPKELARGNYPDKAISVMVVRMLIYLETSWLEAELLALESQFRKLVPAEEKKIVRKKK